MVSDLAAKVTTEEPVFLATSLFPETSTTDGSLEVMFAAAIAESLARAVNSGSVKSFVESVSLALVVPSPTVPSSLY